MDVQFCSSRSWKRDFVARIHKTVRSIKRGLSLDKVELRQRQLDIGQGLLSSRSVRIHDISETMVLNLEDKMEMFGAGLCRARRTRDLGDSVSSPTPLFSFSLLI